MMADQPLKFAPTTALTAWQQNQRAILVAQLRLRAAKRKQLQIKDRVKAIYRRMDRIESRIEQLKIEWNVR